MTARLVVLRHALAVLLVLGSWVGARRAFHLSLFLTAPRMALPKILVLGGNDGPSRGAAPRPRGILSTRILGRRTAPSAPFLIPNRAPHGFTQDPSTRWE